MKLWLRLNTKPLPFPFSFLFLCIELFSSFQAHLLEVKGAQFHFVFLSVPFHHLNGFSFYFLSFAGISLAGWCLKWIVQNWFLQPLYRHQYPFLMASNPTLGVHVLPPYASLSSSWEQCPLHPSWLAAIWLPLVKPFLYLIWKVIFLQDHGQIEGILWEGKMALCIHHMEKSLCTIQSFRCCWWDTKLYLAGFIIKLLPKAVGSSSHL